MANAAQTRTLIGRDAELDRVEEFLGAIDSGPAALLLEGEAGIGKTTLWNQGLASVRRSRAARPALPAGRARDAAGLRGARRPARRRARGRHVRSARAAAARAGGGAAARGARRGAVAPARRRPGPARGAARRWRSRRPTLLAIDDAQWLDHPSESALAFVARRLQDERIGLFCVRRGGGSETPLELDRALPDARFERLALAGLDAGELELLLRSDLGVTLSRRTLERVRRAPGGNLFFALEIGRALVARGGPLEPAEELPIPANLQELVRDRLELLPPAARAAAQVASALSRPTVRVVDAAARGAGAAEAAARGGGGRPRAGLESASHSRIRCSRPSPISCSRLPSDARCTRGSPRSSTTRRSARRHLALAADEAGRGSRDGAGRGRPARRRARGAGRGRRTAGAGSPADAGGGRRRAAAPRHRGGRAALRGRRGRACAGAARGDRRRVAARRAPGACARPPGLGVRARGGIQRGGRRLLRRAGRAGRRRAGSASRSSRGSAGACTRRAASRTRSSTRAPRSSWPRSWASRPCSRARSRSSPSSTRSAARAWRWRRSSARSRWSTRRRGRRCSGGPIGSTGSWSAGRARSPPRARRSASSTARRSIAATSTRCRSCSSRSRASSS